MERMKNFTKNDLRTGMVAETKDGGKYLVLCGDLKTATYGQQNIMIIDKTGFMPIDEEYTDDLKHPSNESYTIEKIYHVGIVGFEPTLRRCNDSTLIWERQEIDWSKVPVDTKVLCWVCDEDKTDKAKRYFSHFEDGNIYCFNNGKTSWNAEGETSRWGNVELAEDIKL